MRARALSGDLNELKRNINVKSRDLMAHYYLVCLWLHFDRFVLNLV